MIYFFNLQPDDYNGFPEIADLFPVPDSNFPKIPTEEEIQQLFWQAGYSAYDMDQEIQQLGQNGFFQQYGNYPAYYAIYVMDVDDMNHPSNLKEFFKEDLREMFFGNRNIYPKTLVDEIKEFPWVKTIFYIPNINT